MFTVSLLTLLLFPTVQSQFSFNLYKTSENNGEYLSELDCLRYFQSEYSMSSPTFGYERFQMVEYCLRPIDTKVIATKIFNDEQLTFKKLRQLNVTTKVLLSWSSTIDLAENYQEFLDGKDSLSEILYSDCEIPWFGFRCEYSLELYQTNEWSRVVMNAFELKAQYGSDEKINDRTCYIHLRCDRGGSAICLDWREICDGRIDCLNDGVDEKDCFQLEIHQCNEKEYHCHNGLCISTEISNDENYLTDCLDRSGTTFLDYYYSECLEDPMFICEEHSCRPGMEQFACGDGECVEDFDECENGRHYLLFESMSIQGNLSEQYWLAMICLTKIKEYIQKRTSCRSFLNSSILFNFLQTCHSPTQFPTIPVLDSHVRFLYDKTEIQLINTELVLPPSYICYDEQLCEFLPVTYRHEKQTCRRADEMGLKSSTKYPTWKSLIDAIKPVFHGCSTRSTKEEEEKYSKVCILVKIRRN